MGRESDIEYTVSHAPEEIRPILRSSLTAAADMTSNLRLEFIEAWCRTYCRKCGRERSDYKCRCWEGIESW